MVSSSSLFLILLLWIESLSVRGAECNDDTEKSRRGIEVASACEETAGVCPEECLPTLQAYYDDCDVGFPDLGFQVLATNNDACFDVVFGFYLSVRGMDCESNLQAFRSGTATCIPDCSWGCEALITGICDYCSGGALGETEARQVEIEISLIASSCERCSLEGSGASPTPAPVAAPFSPPTAPISPPTAPVAAPDGDDVNSLSPFIPITTTASLSIFCVLVLIGRQW